MPGETVNITSICYFGVRGERRDERGERRERERERERKKERKKENFFIDTEIIKYIFLN